MRVAVLVVLCVVVMGLMAGGCTKPKDETGPVVQNQPLTAPPASSGAGAKTKLRVMVPCGMIVPVKAVIDAFEAANPEVDVDGIYDNPLVLVKRNLEKGEKADVFVSPGEVEIGLLEKAGRIDPASKVEIGTFDLVVIVPQGNPLQISKPEDLRKCKTISIPDPDKNSVGRCGMDALTRLGLWDALEPKMLKTEHAITSHEMVVKKKSDAGIAYRNCPLETNPEKLAKAKVTIAFAFDEKDYTKQKCYVAPMKDAENPQAATKFVEFISSEEGRKLLAEKGMSGCLDDLACPVPTEEHTSASAGGAMVDVKAFYPDNEGHAHIKKFILSLPQRYPGKVKSEFIDFTSDEGFKRWQEAGLSCGAVLINNEQTWTYEKNGKPVEVTFARAMGGEWTEEDLIAVLDNLTKGKGGKARPTP